MLNRILFFLFIVLIILFFSNSENLLGIRGSLEKNLVTPIRLALRLERNDGSMPLRMSSLEEKVRRLTEENRILRDQLGAIPEKSRLYPLEVIWSSPAELIVSFPYDKNGPLSDSPIVWGELYVGRVEREGRHMLYVKKPTAANFKAPGKTDREVRGNLRGEYGEQIIFETDIREVLKTGDSVFVIDEKGGWTFLLGKVASIKKDERLPVQRAVVSYAGEKDLPATVFIAL